MGVRLSRLPQSPKIPAFKSLDMLKLTISSLESYNRNEEMYDAIR